MIPVVTALAGAAYGGYQAKRRNGSRADIAQYAVGFGIACGLAGLVVSVLIVRIWG